MKVYSKNNCAACESAKALLKSKGIEFQEFNCDEDFESFDFVVAKGHRSFPVVYTDDGVLFANTSRELMEKLK